MASMLQGSLRFTTSSCARGCGRNQMTLLQCPAAEGHLFSRLLNSSEALPRHPGFIAGACAAWKNFNSFVDGEMPFTAPITRVVN